MAVEIRAATYADLRTALAAGTYQAGQMVFCEGRAAAGDGGQGVFQVRAIGSLTDDSANVLTGGSLAAVRKAEVPHGFTALSNFVSSGATLDVTALNAFLSNDGARLYVDGQFIAGAEIEVTADDVRIIGAGKESMISGNNAANRILVVGEFGTINCTEFYIDGVWFGGTALCAVDFQSAPRSFVGEVAIAPSASMTDGFRFAYFFGCNVLWMSTSSAAIAEKCFKFGAAVNANTFGTLYTSNFAEHNFWMQSDTPNVRSSNNTFSHLCAQGGDVGLYVGDQFPGVTINSLYTENCVNDTVFGDYASAKICVGVTINGARFSGPAVSHPNRASRVAAIQADYCRAVWINAPKFDGMYAVGTVVFAGGSPTVAARGVVRVNVDGTIHSIQITLGGAGYASAPTVAITGQTGSGFAGTVSISGGVVTGVTITNAGTGYTAPANPVAIRYRRAKRVTVTSPYTTISGLDSELWPYVVRTSDAASDSAITLVDDSSWLDPDGQGDVPMTMRKSEGYAYRHYIEQLDDAGARRVTAYIPPAF